MQKRLAARVVKRCTFESLDTIAGVDVSIKHGEARAAIVVLAYPGMELVEQATAVRPVIL